MILHDLRCTKCGGIETDVAVKADRFPRCVACGGKRTWIPSRINTDLGSGFYCEATGQTHTRHRDAELAMAKQARAFTERTGIRWDPGAAGDKVHGARNETKFGSGFSYAGQTSRRSTAERSGAVESRPDTPKRAPAGAARRMTRDDVSEMRKAPVYTGPLHK